MRRCSVCGQVGHTRSTCPVETLRVARRRVSAPPGVYVLGVDPGLRATGWAVIRLGSSVEELVEAGVWTSLDQTQRKNLTRARDDARVLKDLWLTLRTVAGRWHPSLVAYEAPSGSRSARATQAMGMAYALASILAVELDAPSRPCAGLDVLASDAKVAAAGSGNASKTAVAEGVRAWLGAETWCRLLADVLVSRREHAYDAAAVARHALQTPEGVLLRRMVPE